MISDLSFVDQALLRANSQWAKRVSDSDSLCEEDVRRLQDLAKILLDASEHNLNVARLFKRVAEDLADLSEGGSEVIETPVMNAVTVRNRLRLRCKGSALLLIELLRYPGRLQKAEELAVAVCVRKPSPSAIKVFIHDLRNGLARAGMHDVIKRKVRRGYFVSSEDAERILKVFQQ